MVVLEWLIRAFIFNVGGRTSQLRLNDVIPFTMSSLGYKLPFFWTKDFPCLAELQVYATFGVTMYVDRMVGQDDSGWSNSERLLLWSPLLLLPTVCFIWTLLAAWMQSSRTRPGTVQRHTIDEMKWQHRREDATQLCEQAAAGSLRINGVHCKKRLRNACQNPNYDMQRI